MNIALILNVCIPLVSGGDSCEGYIVEVYQSVIPCTIDMQDNPQKLDDRYLSCGTVEKTLLVDRRDNRTVKQIIADLNAAIPYMGGGK